MEETPAAGTTTGSKEPEWYQPTWGRFLFAAVLAIVGFLLPQEVPLEWYPLNEPGDDILYLEIACAANQNGDVRVFYDTGRGFNELNTISWPISPTTQTYTYTFPLPDAPLTAFRIDPLTNGGVLTIRNLRIIDRRGAEVQRWLPETVHPTHQIESIRRRGELWDIKSTPGADDPYAAFELPATIVAKGINHRNLLRSLLSTGYLTLMLWIILLAVLFTFYRPSAWGDFGRNTGSMAVLALLFACVGNRGLIRNSWRYAHHVDAPTPPGLFLEAQVSAHQSSIAELFWDAGQGMSTATSHAQTYTGTFALATLRYPLPEGTLTSLRFDPIMGAGRLDVRLLRVVDAVGRTVVPLSTVNWQSRHEIATVTPHEDGSTEITTTPGAADPILSFSTEDLAAINRALAAQTKR